MSMRLFVAIELEEAVKRELGRLQERLGKRSSGIRWTDPAQMHLTLSFLGSTPDELVPEVCSAMERSAAGVAPFSMRAAGVGRFPERGRPRVVWVGIEETSGRLARLKEELDRQLSSLGLKAEKRAYQPHLTIGRVRVVKSTLRIDEAVSAEAAFAAGAQEVEEVVLFSSELRPEGARYTAVAHAPLYAEKES